MHVPAAAAAGAAAAGAAGLGAQLFRYNRENFQFDAAMRFSRFTVARGFANAQVGQYREDVSDLAEMTVAKMHTWQAVCTLFLCVCGALSGAGRLGMHGAAPPGWLCALYSGNIFSAVLLSGTALWLAMHASLRAQCATVSLLTRKVRLPIPSVSQLDHARAIASSFEQQEVGDVFHVPFMRHTQRAPDVPPAPSEESGQDGEAEEADSNTRFASTTRDTVPSWVRDEQVVDKLGGVPSVDRDPHVPAHGVPEHFKLMQRAAEDWWHYDVYARISMLYGVMCFLFAVSYYAIGTSMAELRGFWISWSVPMLFLVAQALILRLDIVKDTGRKTLPHCEWLGHVAPYLAVMGTTLEYRAFSSPSAVRLTWVFAILAFFGHFMLCLRMLDLAWPDWEPEGEMPEVPTRHWWPRSWKVPSAFASRLWILAPPQELREGQHCLLREMDDLRQGGGGGAACRRRRGPVEAKEVESSTGRCHARSSPEALHRRCSRIDRSFQQLFDVGAWSRLSACNQARLHRLYGEYQSARGRIDRLAKEADDSRTEPGTRDDGEEPSLLARRLSEVEDGLKMSSSHPAGLLRGSNGNRRMGGSPFRDFGPKRAPDLPWQVVRVAVATLAFQWFFMMAVSAVECSLGPHALLKPPGEPPWIRDQRARGRTPEAVHLSSNRTLPDDHALFSPGRAMPSIQMPVGSPEGRAAPEGHGPGRGAGHGAGHVAEHHRRLADHSRRPGAALGELFGALPPLRQLADSIEAESRLGAEGAGPAPVRPEPKVASGVPGAAAFMAPVPKARRISWPPFFEPRHLLCGRPAGAGGTFAALTPRGVGALVPADGVEGETAMARPFALEGIGHFGRLVGAAWAELGLELIAETGELLHCPGRSPPEPGVWQCRAAGERLPVPARSRLHAAATEGPSKTAGRQAALLLQQLRGIVTVFTEDEGGWSPSGEVHLPPSGADSRGRLGLAFSGGELLITMASGEVLRHHIRDGMQAVHPAPPAAGTARWEVQAACGLAGGGLARLALRPQARPNGGVAWVPELTLSAA